MKNKTANIFNFIQYLIILLFIILIVYFSYQKFILKNTSISFFNYNFYVIMSGSMEPTINTKDLIVTHPKDNYEVNDIIAFKNNDTNTTTVHRIVNIEYDNNGTTLITTQGDNNNIADLDKITPDSIIGSYLFTIPLLGSIIIFLSSNPIFIFIILVMIILIYIIIRLIKRLIGK